MHDGIEPFEVAEFDLADIETAACGPSAQLVEQPAYLVEAGVQAGYIVSSGEQPWTEDRPEIAIRACQQDTH